MRVTDAYKFTILKQNLSEMKKRIDSLQGQIASGKKISVPSDDSVIYARSVEIDAEKQFYTQLGRNLDSMTSSGAMYESSLNSTKELISRAKEIALAQSDDTMDPASRRYAAEELKEIIEQLVTVGNTNLAGTYIFGGKRANEAPFRLNKDYSVTYTIPSGAEDSTDVYVARGELGKTGMTAREVFFDTTKSLYLDPDNGYTGDTAADGSYYAYVLDDTNNKLYLNGTALTLTKGVYKGKELATEIEKKLGNDFTVLYDSAARKFSIVNDTGATVTLDWANSGSNVASVLGFDRVNTTLQAGKTNLSDRDSGNGAFLVKVTQDGRAYGGIAERARYMYSTDGGETWSGEIIANYGADRSGDFVVDTSNNALIVSDGSDDYTVTLGSGVYGGSALASHVASQLNGTSLGSALFSVTYDATTRKFTVSNLTSATTFTMKWAASAATAGGLLGYNALDTSLVAGGVDIGDTEAGLTLNAIFDIGYRVDGTNSSIVVSDGTDDYTVTLSKGAYEGAALASHLASVLNGTSLGSVFAVSYSEVTGKFTIQNTTAIADYSLKWSSSLSSARSLLGFAATDETVSAGASAASDFRTDPWNRMYKDGVAIVLDAGTYTGAGLAREIQGKLGTGFRVSFDEAAHQFAIENDSGLPVTLNWSRAEFAIGTSNNALVFNDSSNHTVYLTAGRYTGEALADRIEASLNAVRSGFTVTYDKPSNAFQIQNDTGVSVTFKWSDAAATAADALGFDAADSAVAAGSTDASDFVAGTLDGSIGGLLGYDTADSVLLNNSADLSDFEAGMFIDGTNGADPANNRLKLLFGDSGTLVVNDQFEIKDLTMFDTLKNFMDALENNNTTSIRAAVRDMDGALGVVEKNLTSIGTFQSKIDTLTQEKETRETRFAEISSNMISADLAALIADFNTMLTSYQALMYSVAQTQKLSVMNYM